MGLGPELAVNTDRTMNRRAQGEIWCGMHVNALSRTQNKYHERGMHVTALSRPRALIICRSFSLAATRTRTRTPTPLHTHAHYRPLPAPASSRRLLFFSLPLSLSPVPSPTLSIPLDILTSLRWRVEEVGARRSIDNQRRHSEIILVGPVCPFDTGVSLSGFRTGIYPEWNLYCLSYT